MSVNQSLRLRMGAILLSIITLAACSGGGGYGSGSGGGSGAVSVGGGGVKGPMAGAVVEVYALDFSGGQVAQAALIASGETDAQAKITGLALPFPQSYPYLLVFKSDDDTKDLTTNKAPVISALKTVLTSTLAAKGEQVYATPLTSMAVDIAFENYQDTAADDEADLQSALDAAAAQVASTVGFGLDANKIDIFDTPPLVDDTVAIGEAGDGETPVADVKAYRAAVEALTAVVATINEESTDGASTPETVLNNLAKDLAGDGEIDGDDGQGNVVVEPTSLDVLDKDPETLVIPNTGGKTVAEIEEIVADETADTGNDVSAQEQQAIKDEQTTTQPAARNPDRDGDGVANALDDFPDDASADRDTDGDGNPDVAYTLNSDGSRGAALADCGSVSSKTAAPQSSFACSDADDDADNVSDTDEATDGTDPLDADSDGDTLTDGDEKALGSDPLKADSDDDGVNDPDDNCPVDANADQTDGDGDGAGAACDSDDTVAVPDQDGDGEPDSTDNCLAVFNPAQINTDENLQDGDDQGDACDDDDDADGVNDSVDEFPLNTSESSDNDKDGIGDNADTDDDNDGVPDREDAAPNDRDGDGDGVLDGADEFPTNPNESRDTDKDGTGDNADTDDDNDSVPDAEEADQGTNPRVADTDRDGANDGADNCPALANADQANNDEDAQGDACDTDDDNDTVADDADNCPLIENTDQANNDGDSAGDACDDDDDNDTVADETDNCPTDANTDQLNSDGDEQGNVCDDDDDNDDVADADDACPTTPQDVVDDVDSEGCAPGETDTDNDGAFDNVDNCPAIANPNQTNTDGDEQGDACDADDDNDTISDDDEAANGTNPLLADTDGDDADDADDNCPLTSNADQLDTDKDGDGNACDDDDDNDNVSDADEATKGTDPLLADTDEDTVNDDTDNCPLDSNSDQANQDQDGLGDVCDDDRDGDGTNNDQDAFPDNANEDSDTDSDEVGDNSDNCPAVANADQLDTDGDSEGDACDADDDDDTVLDGDDNCPGTTVEQRSNVDADGCHPDQLTQLEIDGTYRVITMGVNQIGPGAAGDGQFSGTEFEVEQFQFTLDGLNLNGVDGTGNGAFLGRFNGGANFDTFDFGDCETVEDCGFEETLVRRGDVLFVPGFAESEIDDDEFESEPSYESESSAQLAILPVPVAGAAQALSITEFAVDVEFDARDVDGDGVNDPDLDDTDYESSLEPEPGVTERGTFGFLSLGLLAPTEQFDATNLAGEFGYVGLIQSAEVNGASGSAAVDAVRFNLEVDVDGSVSGASADATEAISNADGSVAVESTTGEALFGGSALEPKFEGAPGEVVLTMAFGDDDQIVLNGAMSADTSIGAVNFYEDNNEGSGATDAEVEFGLLLRKATSAPDLADSSLRFNLVGREFTCGFGSAVMLGRALELDIGEAFTTGCGDDLGENTQCFNATLSGVDGDSFLFSAQKHVEGDAFGELVTDGSASDGDYVPGTSFTDVAIVKVNAAGEFVFELVDEDESPAVVEDVFRGFISNDGSVVVAGGSDDVPLGDGCGYANRLIGIGVPVVGVASNAALDNRAPVVNSVSASAEMPIAPNSSVNLTANVSDNENDDLTYEWIARAGTLSAAASPMAGWTAPDTTQGSTVLELRVGDGLHTVVEFVEVSWGASPPSDNQREAALVVMDEALESPEDTADWLLFVVPDSNDLPSCENEAGEVTRTFTDNTPNNGSSDPFDPDVDDVVSVVFNNCVEEYYEFDDEFYGVNAGEFRMTITKATDTEFEWQVDIVNLEFVDGFCNSSVNDCEIEEKEVDNGVYVVKQLIADTIDGTAPQGTEEQIDTFFDFTSYSSAEQEEDGEGGFETIANFSLKSPSEASIFLTEYVGGSDNTLGARLDVDFGYAGTEVGSSTPSIDIDVETGSDGIVQLVDESGELTHASGEQSIKVNALSFVDLAEGWTVNVELEGSDSVNESTQSYVVGIDTDSNGTDDFVFNATQEDVWESDECNINPPSTAADCE